MDFETLPLRDIVQLAKNDNPIAQNYLVRKFEWIVYGIMHNKSYFMKGQEKSDLAQEGLMGLAKAFKDFDESKGNLSTYEAKLENFLRFCVKRALITAIIMSNRHKHSPLNDTLSLDRKLPDNENMTTMDIYGDKEEFKKTWRKENYSPELQLIFEETMDLYYEEASRLLSSREKKVNDLFLQGKTYEEIHEILLYPSTKSVDNALQRVRKKTEHLFPNSILSYFK